MSNKEKEMKIIYKRDYMRHAVILKPDTFYWRLRYWINQYTAYVLALIIKPVVRLNHAVFRLDEGEVVDAMFDSERMGMIAKDNNVFRFTHPKWVINNRERLQKAFRYFRDLAIKL